jgi:hypothetical protein
MGRIMPPVIIYIRSAFVKINIIHVNIRPCVIDPTGTIPAMIDNMVVTPVKVHSQPASDHQTNAKRNEGLATGISSVGIDD